MKILIVFPLLEINTLMNPIVLEISAALICTHMLNVIGKHMSHSFTQSEKMLLKMCSYKFELMKHFFIRHLTGALTRPVVKR